MVLFSKDKKALKRRRCEGWGAGQENRKNSGWDILNSKCLSDLLVEAPNVGLVLRRSQISNV